MTNIDQYLPADGRHYFATDRQARLIHANALQLDTVACVIVSHPAHDEEWFVLDLRPWGSPVVGLTGDDEAGAHFRGAVRFVRDDEDSSAVVQSMVETLKEGGLREPPDWVVDLLGSPPPRVPLPRCSGCEGLYNPDMDAVTEVKRSDGFHWAGHSSCSMFSNGNVQGHRVRIAQLGHAGDKIAEHTSEVVSGLRAMWVEIDGHRFRAIASAQVDIDQNAATIPRLCLDVIGPVEIVYTDNDGVPLPGPQDEILNGDWFFDHQTDRPRGAGPQYEQVEDE